MIKKIISSLILLLNILGCMTIYNPATERKELILIDTKAEVSLGKSIDSQIRQEYRISNDIQLNDRLTRIASKVALVSDRLDLNYKFFVIEDEELNAFAIPGGFVYVNSGLLKKANDDELACVVAHEIGHLAARHSVKKLQSVLGYQILMSITLRNASSVDVSRSVDIVFNLISLGYSREDERLADRLAVKYAFKAGFDPNGMISFFYKLLEEKDKNKEISHIVFLSSHPAVEERIRNMQKEIDLLKHPPKKETQDITQEESKSLSPQKQALANQFNPAIKTDTILAKLISKKKCPVCKKTLPKTFNFCPLDGQYLIF